MPTHLSLLFQILRMLLLFRLILLWFLILMK